MREKRAARRETPFDRLSLDGATTVENIRMRLQWLAHIWQIPANDLPKIKRTPTPELADFVEKYNISLDWLLVGDLKGLQRMMRKRKARRFMTSATMEDDPPLFRPDMTGNEFVAALRTLPESAQLEIEAKIRRMVEDRQP